jgi:hypothetical protein
METAQSIVSDADVTRGIAIDITVTAQDMPHIPGP